MRLCYDRASKGPEKGKGKKTVWCGVLAAGPCKSRGGATHAAPRPPSRERELARTTGTGSRTQSRSHLAGEFKGRRRERAPCGTPTRRQACGVFPSCARAAWRMGVPPEHASVGLGWVGSLSRSLSLSLPLSRHLIYIICAHAHVVSRLCDCHGTGAHGRLCARSVTSVCGCC